MKTTTVNMENFPDELWHQVGIQAATEKIHKKELAIKAFQLYLKLAKEGKLDDHI